jgi:FKBP-type peptidyl-prolyl cis-trans isomerase
MVLVGVATAVACGSSTESSGDSGVTTLQVTDVKLGTGVDAVAGRTLTVQYTGWLYSTSAADHHGGQFDSSRDPGRQPFAFTLGIGQVIRGWDQGIVGMKVGGQRTLVIPPSLAYGSQGAPPKIPSNATLVFDVELVDVR